MIATYLIFFVVWVVKTIANQLLARDIMFFETNVAPPRIF